MRTAKSVAMSECTMTRQFSCCIELLWIITANRRLHSFMSKYVLSRCSLLSVSVFTANELPAYPHHNYNGKYNITMRLHSSITRDVTEPAKIRIRWMQISCAKSVGCGFVMRSKLVLAITATAIQLSYLKLNSYIQTSSE